MYYFRLLFYYNYRHGSIFDYYMADAVFKQAFNSAETARAYDNGIALFLAALLNNFRRRAAADNQHIRAGNVLLIDYMLSSAQNFVAYLTCMAGPFTSPASSPSSGSCGVCCKPSRATVKTTSSDSAILAMPMAYSSARHEYSVPSIATNNFFSIVSLYFTISTGTAAYCETLLLTLPRKNSAMPERPREPITIASA